MKPLLLLHGAIGSAEQLHPLQQSLQRDYDVHVLNFPGHGGTEMPEQFSIPVFADYVKEYCAANDLHKVSIFGYSMGGYVALYLARRYPGLVEKLITLATKFHWTEAIASREIKMLQPDIIEHKLPLFATALQHRHYPNDWKQVVQHTADMLMNLGDKNLLQAEDYAAIQTPSLIMVGDRDKMVDIEETLAVYKQLSNVQLAVLPSTSHPVEQADTNMIAWLLKRFLSK